MPMVALGLCNVDFDAHPVQTPQRHRSLTVLVRTSATPLAIRTANLYLRGAPGGHPHHENRDT